MARPTNVLPLTVAEAKELKNGTILNVYDLHSRDFIRNADGTPARYKVRKVTTWKRQPERVVVSVSFGIIKSHFYLKEDMFQPTPDTWGDGLGTIYKQPDREVGYTF